MRSSFALNHGLARGPRAIGPSVPGVVMDEGPIAPTVVQRYQDPMITDEQGDQWTAPKEEFIVKAVIFVAALLVTVSSAYAEFGTTVRRR